LFSGMIATHSLNRVGYAAEISKDFFDLGINRIKTELQVLKNVI